MLISQADGFNEIVFGNPALSGYKNKTKITIYYNSSWSSPQYGWNMPITNFSYGYLNSSNNNTVYYENLLTNSS
jgi:hypothetical protein